MGQKQITVGSAIVQLKLKNISYNQIMFKLILLVSLALFAVHALHLHQNHESGTLVPGIVNMKSDNGRLLRVCHNCGGTQNDSASIQVATNDATQGWNLEVVGDQVAFKGVNGLYLSRCNLCWPATSRRPVDSVFVYQNTTSNSSLWTPELQSNGKYAFKSDIGKYLSRCSDCTPSPASLNFGFVHGVNTTDGYVQWEVVYLTAPRAGLVTIQADNGGFLKICQSCGSNNVVSVESGSGAAFQWRVVLINGKVSFQASNGNYLSRCNGCLNPSLYDDVAYLHMTNNTELHSQWTPVQSNGKWAFKADSGKYLARCSRCANTAVNELAFVYSTSPSDALSGWTLTYV